MAASPAPTTSSRKLVLLGESAVGKSSLVLQFVKGQFDDYRESTIGAAFLTQTVKAQQGFIKFEVSRCLVVLGSAVGWKRGREGARAAGHQSWGWKLRMGPTARRPSAHWKRGERGAVSIRGFYSPWDALWGPHIRCSQPQCPEIPSPVPPELTRALRTHNRSGTPPARSGTRASHPCTTAAHTAPSSSTT